MRDLDLKLNPDGVPPLHLKLISELVKRAILVKFRSTVRRIPISQLMDAATIVGWALAPPVLRIIDGPSPRDYDDVTIAMSTVLNEPLGRPNRLTDFVNPDQEFAIAVDQNLIAQALSRALDSAFENGTIPQNFNEQGHADPSGRIRIEDITPDLQQGQITFIVKIRILPNAGTFSIFGSLTLGVQDGYLRARFDPPQVEFPWQVTLLGFLAFSLAWLLIREIISLFLGGLIQEVANTGLDEFLRSHEIRLAFEGAVPRTHLRLRAKATELLIADDEIISRGMVDFIQA